MLTTLINDRNNEHYLNFRARFEQNTDRELAELYFRQQKVGITGVRMQAYYLLALRDVLVERFGDSPIEFDEIKLEM